MWDFRYNDIGPGGVVYSVNKAIGLCLLLPYYIYTIDGARRLGRSEYYLHPTRLEERSRARGRG